MMHLPKNFGILQKSQVESLTLSTSKNSPKLSRLFFAFDFRKSLTDTTESFENFRHLSKMSKIYQNFWHLTVFVKNSIYKMAQILPNWSKMNLKMVKNHKNYAGIFDFLPKMANFWLSIDCQKCTKIFDFRLSTFPVHFPKITQNSETVTGMHGLNLRKSRPEFK